MADGSPSLGSPLPHDLEARLFEILLELPPDERERAFAELLAQNPAHRELLQDMAASLLSGEVVAATLAADGAAAGRLVEVGPYRLVRELGAGGFGVVYLAEQTEPVRRQVALKLMAQSTHSRRLVGRFLGERQTLALLDHPNVARFFEAGLSADGRPYFAMEYVQGISITEHCARERLELGARLQLFVQCCAGVQHAHQKGIIHRDLKPSNVLVTVVDGKPIAKIIDFGIAKALAATGAATTQLTQEGHLLGTPEYMSPEQAEGAWHDVDTRADVYALGVLLHELLVGDLPVPRAELRDKGPLERARLLRDHEATNPSERARALGLVRRARELRGDLDCVVQKALAKEREQRYASVGELADDIARFLALQPVRAGPQSRLHRLKKTVRRYRMQLGAAALVALTLVGGTVVSLALYERANSHLANFELLEDVVMLEQLTAQAENELWPARPEKVAALERWRSEAHELVRRRPLHLATLAALGGPPRSRPDSRPASGAPPADAARPGATQAELFLRDQLTKLVEGSEALAAEGGLMASVEKRLAWARRVAGSTIEEQREAWERTSSRVAASAAYGGLRIRPQIGLIPLGPDPGCGLLEFALAESGTAPRRDEGGRLVLEDDTAIVLVLLPGGDVKFGAQLDDPDAPFYDPDASIGELGVGATRLDPFFLAKHETTKRQWASLEGKSHAYYQVGYRVYVQAAPVSLRHPEDSVSWRQAKLVADRHGLLLPTQVQWEYACRAGTTQRWYTGDTVRSLRGHANLADRSCKLEGANIPWTLEKELDDGHVVHAPVGSFLPNGFGLHDMHGNVFEWCGDPVSRPTFPVRAGDGRAEPPDEGRDLRAGRGGSFSSSAVMARCALRQPAGADKTDHNWGVRFARALDR